MTRPDPCLREPSRMVGMHTRMKLSDVRSLAQDCRSLRAAQALVRDSEASASPALDSQVAAGPRPCACITRASADAHASCRCME